jgi:methyl-accepting chemotaxis protein
MTSPFPTPGWSRPPGACTPGPDPDLDPWSAPLVRALGATHALALFRLDGALRWASPRFSALLELPPEALAALHHRDLLPLGEAATGACGERWARVRRGEPVQERALRLTPGGRELWLDCSDLPVLDAGGAPRRIALLARDVTEARAGRVHKVLKVAQVVDSRAAQGELFLELGRSLKGAEAELRGSTAALQGAVEQNAEASPQQAVAVAEVTSTLSELRQTSQQALESAERLDGMSAIRDRVSIIQERILTLAEHTQQIGEIISTVNEIAEQSKQAGPRPARAGCPRPARRRCCAARPPPRARGRWRGRARPRAGSPRGRSRRARRPARRRGRRWARRSR